MLVLSRKEGEFITVIDRETGKEILRITTVKTDSRVVRIGFEAEHRYEIVRGELLPKPE